MSDGIASLSWLTWLNESLGVPAGASIHWLHPEWFILAGVFPVWIALRRLWHHWRQLPLPDEEVEVLAQGQVSRFRHPLWAKFIRTQSLSSGQATHRLPWGLTLLRVGVLGLAIVAMAQPYWLKTPPAEAQQKTVRDIMFVIESSVSFVLPDYQLNGQPATRMQVVKSVLDPFMAQLQGNRFGITVYAEQAFTLLPLTTDTTASRLTLKRLRPNLAGRTDEGLGEALGLALQQTDQATPSPSTMKRIIILISDGLNQPSRLPLTDVVTYAKAMNVPIYAIGVGSGSRQADHRTTSGLIYQPLQAGVLKQLAQETGGAYYPISNQQDLQKVLRAIDQSAGVPMVDVAPPKQKVLLYFWPLAMALVLWGLYTLLALRWIQRRTRLAQEPVA